ncbi:hypothetical protein ABZ901_07590 [Actinacidiphila alni]|uniref:hypothetical protein n=1 Tax=Actinacidiphila alni TaxID=380248 RepID=UPI0033EAE83E
MIDVHIEEAALDDGIPVVYRAWRGGFRVAFDPRQVSEEAALAVLCLLEPQLLGRLRVHRGAPPGHE